MKLCFMGCPYMSMNQLITWTKDVEQGLKKHGKKKVVVPTVFTAAPGLSGNLCKPNTRPV